MKNQAQKTVPAIPWEERPPGSDEVVWRYSGNSIIPRDLIPSANSIFNSAADTVTALAFCKMDELLTWLQENDIAPGR